MPASDTRPADLPALTGVRFLLAMWVVALHVTTANVAAGTFFARHLPGWVEGILESGASAVGIFFLLSGFVLAYSYDLGAVWDRRLLRRFWSARLARIYPVYLFALVLGLPSLVAGTVKAGAQAGAMHASSLAGGMLAVLLLVQAWIPQDALLWSGPGWSLSAEAFFYLCFPFAGALLWRLKGRTLQVASLAALWATACGVAWAIAAAKAAWMLGPVARPDDVWSEVVKFDPLVRLPEFLAGVVLCKLFVGLARQTEGRLRMGRGQALYLPGMLVLVLVTANARAIPPALLHDGLLLPASAAMLLGLALGGGWVAGLLSRRRMVLLGKSSYATYILHMPLFSYFAATGKRLPGGWWPGEIGFFLVCLTGLSVATFLKLEEPARRTLMRRLAGSGGERTGQPVAADPF